MFSFPCLAQSASVKLEIKKLDGSTYWIEHFDNKIDGDKWLAEEITRKYWKFTYNPIFTILNDHIETPSQIARTKRISDAKIRVNKEKINIDRMTLPELKSFVKDIVLVTFGE
jgi:hypothetical protein